MLNIVQTKVAAAQFKNCIKKKTIGASDTQNDANIELVSIGQRNMQKVC